MGRQLRFFMDKKTEEIFIAWLRQNFLLVNTRNEPYNFEEEHNMCCCYKKEYGDLIYRSDNGKIDILESPIIEFSRTGIKEKKRIILEGRLWINSTGKNKDDKIIKDYQKMVKWVKKNIPYQEVGEPGNVKKLYINNTLISLLNEGYKLIV